MFPASARWPEIDAAGGDALAAGRTRASLLRYSVIPGRRGQRRKPILCCQAKTYPTNERERAGGGFFAKWRRKRVKKSTKATWRLDFEARSNLLDPDRPKKESGGTFKAHDCSSFRRPPLKSATLRLQTMVISRRVATTPAATPTGGPAGKTFSAKSITAGAATREQNRIRNDIGERQFCRHARLRGVALIEAGRDRESAADALIALSRG